MLLLPRFGMDHVPFVKPSCVCRRPASKHRQPRVISGMPLTVTIPPFLGGLYSSRVSLPRTRPFSFTSFSRYPRLPENRTFRPSYPSFREEVAKTSTVKSFSQEVKHPSIRNQVFVRLPHIQCILLLCVILNMFQFFLFGSFVVYSLAAKQTNNDTAYWTKRLSESGNILFKVRPPTSEEMRRARYYDLGKVWYLRYSSILCLHYPTAVAVRAYCGKGCRRRMAEYDQKYRCMDICAGCATSFGHYRRSKNMLGDWCLQWTHMARMAVPSTQTCDDAKFYP